VDEVDALARNMNKMVGASTHAAPIIGRQNAQAVVAGPEVDAVLKEVRRERGGRDSERASERGRDEWSERASERWREKESRLGHGAAHLVCLSVHLIKLFLCSRVYAHRNTYTLSPSYIRM